MIFIYNYYLDNIVSNIPNKPNARLLTNYDINQLYLKLYEYTQVEDNIKIQHIKNIEE